MGLRECQRALGQLVRGLPDECPCAACISSPARPRTSLPTPVAANVGSLQVAAVGLSPGAPQPPASRRPRAPGRPGDPRSNHGRSSGPAPISLPPCVKRVGSRCRHLHGTPRRPACVAHGSLPARRQGRPEAARLLKPCVRTAKGRPGCRRRLDSVLVDQFRPRPADVLRRLLTALTRSKIAARALFGGGYTSLAPGEHHFDITTVALVRKARTMVPRGARVLDLGTGSAAVLGLWCWRHLGCTVIYTDVDLEIMRRARENVVLNGAPPLVLCCPFFEGLRAEFDVVLFNPPYVPTSVGEARGLPERWRTQWNGGPEGVDVISAFLQAFADRGGDATALMGVNRRHVSRVRVTSLLERQDLTTVEIWSHAWLPVDVYVLVRRKSPKAKASRPEP